MNQGYFSFNNITTKTGLIIIVISLLFISSPKTGRAESARIFGKDRFETAVEISKTGWQNSETVVLAQGMDFPDALAGVPYAHKKNAPILLTLSDRLPDSTRVEINRLKAENVILLGGEGAISKQVEDYLKRQMGLNVNRIAGKDRFETANQIARQMGSYNKAFIVNGLSFADALSVASYAAKTSSPILLSQTNSMTNETKDLLKGIKESYIIGGSGVISDQIKNQVGAIRIGGKDRYETGTEVLKNLDIDFTSMYLATGGNFADALTGAVLAARSEGTVLLMGNNLVPTGTSQFLKDKLLINVTTLGGPSVVTDSSINQVKTNVQFDIQDKSKPIIFYSPHPDDELLSMGVGIGYYLNRGFNVHVVLISKGRESKVYETLLSEYPELTREEFGEARVREFLDAVSRLKVPQSNVHIFDYPDGTVSKEDVENIILQMEQQFPGAYHRAFSFQDAHHDHRQTGLALKTLYEQHKVRDAQFFISALQLNQLKGFNIPVRNNDEIHNSIKAYEITNPTIGRYAIGIKSVPTLFNNLSKNPISKIHNVDMNLDAQVDMLPIKSNN